MKPWLKRLLFFLSVLMLLVCVLCVAYIFQYFRGATLNRDLQQLAVIAPAEEAEAPAEETPATPEPADSLIPEEKAAPTMEAAVDFDALWEINDEIYAYLDIPGTTISHPVVQSAEDNLYYHKRAVDGSYYSGGSIYSQQYNTKTFEDPHTVLYGHNMRSGDMFGLLSNFADAEFFREHPTMYIHTPDTVYEYRIFAACLHNNEHLLANYDFSDPEVFRSFFAGIREEETLSGNFADEAFPTADDCVLTLSTCHSSRNRRFLVMGTLIETYTVTDGEPAA